MAEEMGAAGHLGEGFVDRDALDERCEVALYRSPRPEALIFTKIATDEDELRTKLASLAAEHARRGPSTHIYCREHHAVSHADRRAAQGRIEELFGRGVEGVQIGMELAGSVSMALPAIPRLHLNRIDVEIGDVDVAGPHALRRELARIGRRAAVMEIVASAAVDATRLILSLAKIMFLFRSIASAEESRGAAITFVARSTLWPGGRAGRSSAKRSR